MDPHLNTHTLVPSPPSTPICPRKGCVRVRSLVHVVPPPLTQAIDSVIYDLLEACVCGPLGHFLASGVVTSIMSSCVSIFLEVRHGLLLRFVIQ